VNLSSRQIAGRYQIRGFVLILPLLVAVLRCLGSDEIVDPVRFFVADRVRNKDDVLLRIDMDADHDGRDEVYLSWERQVNGKAGNTRAVFLPGNHGFANMTDVDFSPKLFYVGFIRQLHGYGIISYLPTSAEEGSFIAHVFQTFGNSRYRLG
jgi:hypothetical protein